MISKAVIEDVENLQFKIPKNFVEISQNFMSQIVFSINIQEEVLWKEIQYAWTILWNLSEKGKGFKTRFGPNRSGRVLDSGHLRLNSSSDGFFKQASSGHSLLTQKILLEIRRNTTLIPTGYHTNTLINVP